MDLRLIVALCAAFHLGESVWSKSTSEILHQNLCVCPCGNPVGGKLFFIPRNKELNWFDAVSYCNALGMSVASITNQYDDEELQRFLDQQHYRVNVPYWIGANGFRSSYGEMCWGLTQSSVEYNRWAPGEPLNRAHACVLLNGGTMQWSTTKDCATSRRKFICEYIE